MEKRTHRVKAGTAKHLEFKGERSNMKMFIKLAILNQVVGLRFMYSKSLLDPGLPAKDEESNFLFGQDVRCGMQYLFLINTHIVLHHVYYPMPTATPVGCLISPKGTCSRT